jgi:alpha-galactosidase
LQQRTRTVRRRLRHAVGALALVVSGALLIAAGALTALGAATPASALDNGLARTPQMGFNDWNAYGCNISESLIKSTALAMHDNGMQAAGYTYVNIDDCWMTHSRNSSGQLVPDPASFPTASQEQPPTSIPWA